MDISSLIADISALDRMTLIAPEDHCMIAAGSVGEEARQQSSLLFGETLSWEKVEYGDRSRAWMESSSTPTSNTFETPSCLRDTEDPSGIC